MASLRKKQGNRQRAPGAAKNRPSSATGIEALLLARGKSLQVGQEIRFKLVKAPTVTTSDPMNDKAPAENFPQVAKFQESVVKPDFLRYKRFYQQDIPLPKDDSDEEQEAVAAGSKKRRWRRKKEGPRRQWVLQEEEDYLETMIAQREQGKNYKQDMTSVSTRYEGIPEHNPSHFVIIGVNGKNSRKELQVSTLPPPHSIHAFSQPAKVKSLSMTEAEQAIEDQRSHMTRYMMHRRPTAGAPSAPVPSSKTRLMGKLRALAAARQDEGDDDDIMGDVKFESRKGSASKARKELLSSMADEVPVDMDGVVGGANDAEFGGKRRFAKLNVEGNANVGNNAAGKTAASNDGMAMADDFYKRDVKAEYEELDYDANEQFDDDDVDHGEADVDLEGGFADESDDSGNDEDDEDEDDGEKKEGFASTKGLKDMLAKARGEAPDQKEGAAANGAGDGRDKDNKDGDNDSRPSSPNPLGAASLDDGGKKDPASADDGNNSGLANVMAAAKQHRENAQRKPAPKPVQKPTGVQTDEYGQRILTLEAVRYEIFLHKNVIQTKKLMKIFSIKKKSAPERIKSFQSIIKELCNMVRDPVHGNMLKLKQHYSK